MNFIGRGKFSNIINFISILFSYCFRKKTQNERTHGDDETFGHYSSLHLMLTAKWALCGDGCETFKYFVTCFIGNNFLFFSLSYSRFVFFVTTAVAEKKLHNFLVSICNKKLDSKRPFRVILING
jgi:hypothetical protein